MKKLFSWCSATVFLLALAFLPLSVTAEPMAKSDAFVLVKAIGLDGFSDVLAQAENHAIERQRLDQELNGDIESRSGSLIDIGVFANRIDYAIEHSQIASSQTGEGISKSFIEVGWRSC